MAKATKKRWPLPKRFSVAMTEEAYAELRSLSAQTGLGNNYLLTILLEKLDRYGDRDKLNQVFEEIFEIYGNPRGDANVKPPAKR